MSRPATVLNISLPSMAKKISSKSNMISKPIYQQNYKEPALGQIIDLWNRYINYREKLGEFAAPQYR